MSPTFKGKNHNNVPIELDVEKTDKEGLLVTLDGHEMTLNHTNAKALKDYLNSDKK